MTVAEKAPKTAFSGYEKFLIAILTVLQFTVILDFMVLSPLGAILMPALAIDPQQFGWVVSAYAFSAGASGLLAAGFADRFDRKRMLIVFYAGFLGGTLLCGIAPDYYLLLGARIVTGIFGGVISSICFAIVTDIFAMQVRGRVMGFLQMAFASSQVLGIPVGLYAANKFGWHSPFLMIVALGLPVGLIIVLKMRPVDSHLKLKLDRHPLHHLYATVTKPRYLRGFAATTLLATGGFMLMPFGSAFGTGNLGLSTDDLPTLYMVTGITAMIAGPIAGRLSDAVGKYKVFVAGSTLGMVLVLIYTNLGVSPLWLVTLITAALFAAITARIVGASALMSGVPAPQDRGAFMGVSSAFQQISGGIASAVAGAIVVKTSSGALARYDILGYVVISAMLITIVMMYTIHRLVMHQDHKG
ncbi:MFS transporter [Turneriella parva]|uniref:Major facilitator superfamily MFS_1 n=1 Tax=Turneriella parva (strain ATCC BAA-1111 / DSM 21527 / NCTC 11395 / H) TaxID=869212 RepID=I4B498_TURPD|nr:MFS transporter [Turneriella parva]AFM12105.1 major facilitator superfamily MFS_1 [Turneriella parva DSM 21527]